VGRRVDQSEVEVAALRTVRGQTVAGEHAHARAAAEAGGVLGDELDGQQVALDGEHAGLGPAARGPQPERTDARAEVEDLARRPVPEDILALELEQQRAGAVVEVLATEHPGHGEQRGRPEQGVGDLVLDREVGPRRVDIESGWLFRHVQEVPEVALEHLDVAAQRRHHARQRGPALVLAHRAVQASARAQREGAERQAGLAEVLAEVRARPHDRGREARLGERGRDVHPRAEARRGDAGRVGAPARGRRG
jgi:hypothetical protein